MGMPNYGEPMAREWLGRVDRMEQRLNELMRRFDEHQGSTMGRQERAERDERVETRQVRRRDRQPAAMDRQPEDPRPMLEELRKQLEQLKAQMMKLRKAQEEARPEKG